MPADQLIDRSPAARTPEAARGASLQLLHITGVEAVTPDVTSSAPYIFPTRRRGKIVKTLREHLDELSDRAKKAENVVSAPSPRTVPRWKANGNG